MFGNLRHHSITATTWAVVTLGICVLSRAAVPTQIAVQGQLTDAGGIPLTAGDKSFTFRVFDAPSLGNQIWPLPGPGGEPQTIGTGADGLWTANVGAANALSDAVFSDTVRWLEITVNDGINPVVTLPRIRLNTGPYAFRVATVDGASGGTITSKVSIGPGHTNTGSDAFVVGLNNAVSGAQSSVTGGLNNTASGTVAHVAGGVGNVASGDWSTVNGGFQDTASGSRAAVGGGQWNVASNLWSTVGGGGANYATGQFSVVAGGNRSLASGVGATVCGGEFNRARGSHSVVAGGGGLTDADSNLALGSQSTIGGGSGNIASGGLSTISGGVRHVASGDWSTVGGGFQDTASGSRATVGGGQWNVASNAWSTVGGGGANYASGYISTIAGGNRGIASGDYSAIGGGNFNVSGGPLSFVGGGLQDSALGDRSTVGGGQWNVAMGTWSTVGGGGANYATSTYATVAGGNRGLAAGEGSFVGGGGYDSAYGSYSTVPGGLANAADGNYSFAAGRRAKAGHAGAFVWADTTDADFASTAVNQFLIRAGGGVGIGTDAPEAPLHISEGSAGATTAHSNAVAAFERNGNAYVQLLTPDASENGLLFGTPSASVGGAVLFNTGSVPNGLEFRTNTNDFAVAINAAGSVGINTTAPYTRLSVDGTIGFKNGSGAEFYMFETGAANADRMIIAHSPSAPTWGLEYQDVGDKFAFLGNGSPAMTVDLGSSGGFVGFGSITAPSNIVTLPNSNSTSGRALGFAWDVYSSRRWKTNIRTIEDALGKVSRLRGVSYDPIDGGSGQIGLVAEDVGQVVPEVVQYEENGIDARSIDYARLVAVLIEGMKEQQKQIESQRRRIEQLEEKLTQ